MPGTDGCNDSYDRDISDAWMELSFMIYEFVFDKIYEEEQLSFYDAFFFKLYPIVVE